MKKTVFLILVLLAVFTMMAGCGNNESTHIDVIAREEGSGTRDAFVELMGIKEDNMDNTAITAEISSSTAVVMITVAGNENAIGYISLGSLNDMVKAISIDGVEPTANNIKAGKYAASRPFNIVTGKEPSHLARDFITFVMSSRGQTIIGEEGYIQVNEKAASYTEKPNMAGRLVMAGSTSVAPVMDVLADAYKEMYPQVEIEIQQTGSGAGITSTVEGACDIGLSSRELKAQELAKGVSQKTIALDGIVVVVNLENSVNNLTGEEIRQIFTGEVTRWDNLTSAGE